MPESFTTVTVGQIKAYKFKRTDTTLHRNQIKIETSCKSKCVRRDFSFSSIKHNSNYCITENTLSAKSQEP